MAVRQLRSLATAAGVGLGALLALMALLVAMRQWQMRAGQRRASSLAARWAAQCSLAGYRFPTLEGETLAEKRVRLPGDAAGKVALLVVGFADAGRQDLEAWTTAFGERFGMQAGVTRYSIPIVSRLDYEAMPDVVSRMREGTPIGLWDHVLIVAGAVEAMREALCAGRESGTWAYLVDRDGRVLHQTSGWSEDKFAELRAIADEAVVGSPPPEA